jgi:Flp pilus assembly protein TadG
VRLSQENGTVTAELAVALPVVGFMLAVVVGVFGLLVERLQLSEDAAMAARAVARGEDTAFAEKLVAGPNRKIAFKYLDDLVCAEITQAATIASLPSFDLLERSCSRKAGM